MVYLLDNRNMFIRDINIKSCPLYGCIRQVLSDCSNCDEINLELTDKLRVSDGIETMEKYEYDKVYSFRVANTYVKVYLFRSAVLHMEPAYK